MQLFGVLPVSPRGVYPVRTFYGPDDRNRSLETEEQ